MTVFIPIGDGKAPLDARWSSEAYKGCDPDEFARIALRCDDLVIVDCDTPEAAKAWVLIAGHVPTEIVKTPRGAHFYYAHTPGSPTGPAVGVLPGMDIRAGRGSYVLCPPTEGYESRTPDDRLPAPFEPAWLPERHTGPLVDDDDLSWDTIPEGRRNVTLAAFAGTFRRQGMSPEAVFKACHVLNKLLCEEPLDRDEVALIAQSVSRNPSRPAIQQILVDE